MHTPRLLLIQASSYVTARTKVWCLTPLFWAAVDPANMHVRVSATMAISNTKLSPRFTCRDLVKSTCVRAYR